MGNQCRSTIGVTDLAHSAVRTGYEYSVLECDCDCDWVECHLQLVNCIEFMAALSQPPTLTHRRKNKGATPQQQTPSQGGRNCTLRLLFRWLKSGSNSERQVRLFLYQTGCCSLYPPQAPITKHRGGAWVRANPDQDPPPPQRLKATNFSTSPRDSCTHPQTTFRSTSVAVITTRVAHRAFERSAHSGTSLHPDNSDSRYFDAVGKLATLGGVFSSDAPSGPRGLN